MNHTSISICANRNKPNTSFMLKRGRQQLHIRVKMCLAPHIRGYLLWFGAKLSPLWRKPSLLWNLSTPYSWDWAPPEKVQLLARTFSLLLMPRSFLLTLKHALVTTLPHSCRNLSSRTFWCIKPCTIQHFYFLSNWFSLVMLYFTGQYFPNNFLKFFWREPCSLTLITGKLWTKLWDWS